MKQTLNKTDVIRTARQQILFECMYAGMKIKEAAKEAKIGYNYARKLSSKGNISALVLQERSHIQAKTEESLHITREGQAKKFEKVIDAGHENGQLSAVNGAIRGQNELCGLVRDKDTDMAKISLAAALTALARSESRQIAPTGQDQPLLEATTDETE